MIMRSKLGLLSWYDFLIGFLLAVGSACGTALLDQLEMLGFNIDWRGLLLVGAINGVTYILKQIASNSKGKLFTKEPKNDNKNL